MTASVEARALPLTDAQLRFALVAETTGRRVGVPLLFRLGPGSLRVADVAAALDGLLDTHPALGVLVDLTAGLQCEQVTPAEVTEWQAESPGAASQRVADAIDAFEEAVDGAAVSAQLIRTAEADLLLLVFDHTSVDEQSLLLIKSYLATPPGRFRPPVDRQQRWRRYAAAVEDRLRAEALAAQGSGVGFWSDRLAAMGDRLPQRFPATPSARAVYAPPALAMPAGVNGPVFPLVLAALHRALRDLDGPGPTLVGYPWGQRNDEFSDVVGCFLNTVLSIDTTGDWPSVADGVRAFQTGWWDELDHADVPFSATVAAGSALPGRPWSGHLGTVLLFENATTTPVRSVLGQPADEIEPSHAVPNAPVTVAVLVTGSRLHLRVVADKALPPGRDERLGIAFRHRLTEILARSGEGEHR